MDGPTREDFERAAHEARVLEVRMQAGRTIDERFADYLAHCAEVAKWQAGPPSPRDERDHELTAARVEAIFSGPQAPAV